jgi:hypothetical protein
MAKDKNHTKRYAQLIMDVLTEYVERRNASSNNAEMIAIFDREKHHYQVLTLGWRKYQRIFLVIFHFDIKDGKIWAQQNASDYDIIGDLEDRGVPKSDIVLAFHSPNMRPYTDYAVA